MIESPPLLLPKNTIHRLDAMDIMMRVDAANEDDDDDDGGSG